MSESVGRIDLHRPSVGPVAPVLRRRRTDDGEHEHDEREREERKKPPPPPAEGPSADGHIDVIA